MIAAAPTTSAPAARATSIVSRVDPPVVTTSSTTRTFSPGVEREAAPQRQRAVLPLGEDRADAQRRAPTSWPMTMPPSAGDSTTWAPSVERALRRSPRRTPRPRAGAAARARTAGSRGCAARTSAGNALRAARRRGETGRERHRRSRMSCELPLHSCRHCRTSATTGTVLATVALEHQIMRTTAIRWRPVRRGRWPVSGRRLSVSAQVDAAGRARRRRCGG